MQLTSLVEKIYAKPGLRICMHFLFWLLLFGVKLYITIISFNVYAEFPFSAYLSMALVNTLLLAIFYYLLVYGIIPHFKSRKRFFIACLLTISLIIAFTAIDAFSEMQLIKNCAFCILALDKNNAGYASYLNHGLINVIFSRLLSLGTPLLLLFTLCIPLSLKFALQSFRDKLQALQMARDNLQLEFNFLKVQLNPHFLFNSMNNIYGLIISGDNKRSATLVARLSELLRYTLYDSNTDTVPVEREIKLMQDFVELEKVRLNDTKVSFDFTIDHYSYKIAPLLLIPLIENAFKFCGDNVHAFIAISLNVEKSKLHLSIRNTIGQRLESTAGGIGINNFKKRMELYYKGKYSYNAGAANSIYSVNLSIML